MTTTSAQVDPTRILEDAVADFRSALTPEEQIRLDNEHKGGLPDSNAAFTFTASLDRINATKRKGQSVASRLFSLIQSVQQFTNIIDTYVSANPEVSALVWSSMKLTFMVIANLVSYFEAFSKLFLPFESMRPRFEEYSLLFPSSLRLRTALCHFHASIIRCCKEAIVVSRRPWQHQLFCVFFSSFQTEMMPFVQDIELKAKEVKHEISLAKAQADRDEHLLQEQERREACRHRYQITQFLSKSSRFSTAHSLGGADEWRKAIVDRRSMRTKRALLDALSTYDHIAAFRQARRRRFTNTCQWVCRAPEFMEWCQSAVSSTLILSGKIGSGKTVLSSAILDHLFHDRGSGTSIMFYHVCFDNTDSLQSDTLIRSLIRQNLDPESLSQRLYTLLVAAENSMFSLESLYNLLKQKLKESKDTYIVIDGFDELSVPEGKLVINTLRGLVNDSAIVLKLFFSTRDGGTNDLRKTFIGSHHISLQGEGQKEDMKSYITQVIKERIETGDLVVEDDTLISEIRDALVRGAQGMFLWVALEIEDLCFQCSDAAIRAILEDLPKSLTETFNRALRRILTRGRNSKEVVKRILQIVAATARPLTLTELAEAASIEVGQKFWRNGQRLNNIIAVPTWCESLVGLDEESQVVQFIHHTVKKFILQEPSSGSSTPTSTADLELRQFQFSFEQASHALGEICVTYLGLDDFKKSVGKQYELWPVFEPKTVASLALKSNWNTRAVDTLASLVSAGKQFSATSGETSRVESVARLDSFRANGSEPPYEAHKDVWVLLDYASKYWLNHTATFSSRSHTNSNCWRLFLEMIPGTHMHPLARTPWKAQEFEDPFPEKVLRWADEHLHIALLRYLLMQTSLDRPNWNLRDRLALLTSRPEYRIEGGLLSQFRETFRLSHASFVALYGAALAATATTSFPPGPIGLLSADYPLGGCESCSDNPLNEALCDAIRLRGVSDEREFGQLVLLAAAWHGNPATIRTYGDLADKARTTRDGKTAMHLAAEAGHVPAVRELIAAQGVQLLDAMTKGTWETPYHLAIKNNHHVVARYILSRAGTARARTGELHGSRKTVRFWGSIGKEIGDEDIWGSDYAERGDSDYEAEMCTGPSVSAVIGTPNLDSR